MQGKITAVRSSKKGNPIVTVNGTDYFSKTNHPSFLEGKEIKFETTSSVFKGKTYNWIVEGSVSAIGAETPLKKEEEKTVATDKNRGFAASYAKDMIIAGKVSLTDLDDFERLANAINDWICGMEDIGADSFPPEE